MDRSVILAVTADERYLRGLNAAFGQVLLPQPVHVSSGEQGVLWIGANTCDLCILDYDLPDTNSLDTLLQMRQRKPTLAVIIVSSANSESAAIAAFRQGIIDYFPKGDQESPLNLAYRANAYLQATGDRHPLGTRRAPPHAPTQLQQPTYQHRLRVIGRQLDRDGSRSVNLVEVAGGFLVRAIGRGQRTPEALEFPDRDFQHLVARGFAARGEDPWERPTTVILPTGYEDFLRAIGFRLDQRSTEAVSIVEFDDIVVVGGVGLSQSYGAGQLAPFHMILRKDEIEYMLDEAFRRRAWQPPTQPKRGFRRFMRGS